MAQTRERMRTTFRVILILMQASSRASQHTTLAQKMATTWRQLFTWKSLTAPPPHLQENKRKRTALPVNRNSAVKTLLRRSKQTNFCCAIQQLANNNNSSSFLNNIVRISKFPKSLTTPMHTFDGKSEKFELFEDLSERSIKAYGQLTEDDRINYFHSLMRGDALQTNNNFNGTTRENLGEILAVFRRDYVKPQSMVFAKHDDLQKLFINPANQK